MKRMPEQQDGPDRYVLIGHEMDDEDPEKGYLYSSFKLPRSGGMLPEQLRAAEESIAERIAEALGYPVGEGKPSA